MVSGAGSKWNLVPLQHGKAKRARQITASTQLSPPISTLYSPWSSEINHHQFFFIHECHPLSFGFDELDHFVICLFDIDRCCVKYCKKDFYGCHRFSQSLIVAWTSWILLILHGHFCRVYEGILRTNHQDKRGQKDTQSQKRRHLPWQLWFDNHQKVDRYQPWSSTSPSA